jgi:tetratricopeptide (TPR) repeat protein
MVDLLSTKLDGAAGLRTVDPQALRNVAGQGGGAADPERARLVARRFGAGRFVLGRVVEAGGRLLVTATIYDGNGTPQGSVETTAGDAARIFDLVDNLAEHLLAKAQDTPLTLARIADQTTSSLPALEAYIEGEHEERATRLGPAREAFQRATELDSTFALAWYRLGVLAPSSAQARDLLVRALRYSGRLGEHQRKLIEAKLALVRGEHRLAEQLYRHILADHPDDVEAWDILAWIIFTKSPLLGLAWIDAREPLEHVVQLDSQRAGGFFMLSFVAAREGRRADLDWLTERFLRLDPSSEFAGDVRGQRAVVLGDTAGLERFVADLRSRPDARAQRGAGLVTVTTMNLVVGRRLWGLIAEPSRSPGFQALAHVILAKLELTNGRERAAEAQLERAMALDSLSAFEHRVYYALIPYLETPRSELLALRDSLTRWQMGKPPEGGDGLANLHRLVHPYLRLYLLGLLSARVGDEGQAQRYAVQLEQVDSSATQGQFANDLAPLLRSEIASARGRVPEALATLELAAFWTRHSASDDPGDSPFTSRMHERWARAELLYQLKRYDEAVTWYRTLIYDFVYTGPAHFRTAQIAELRGERQQAIEHYQQFIELWRDCDPALLRMRGQAESAVARLRAQLATAK